MDRGISMQVICPKCGSLEDAIGCCATCQEPLEWIGKNYEISQKHYVLGYTYAAKRQLTQAIPHLQKAVSLNKYHIDAKNVLGLVYFELGQVGEALKIWILSTSVCKENNPAYDYIHDVQKQPKQLEMYKETIQLYNRALHCLSKKNDDTAVIRLKKAIGLNPKFVEARNLLALCYIYENQYAKAKEQLIKLLEIDTSNEKALFYLKHLICQTEEIEQQQTSVISSPHLHQVQVDGKPHQITSGGHMLGRYVLYFIFGVMCMYIVQVALVIPAKTEELQGRLYDTINENSSIKLELDQVVKEAYTAHIEAEETKNVLTKQYEDVKEENTKLIQEKRMTQVSTHKNKGEWIEAAKVLYTIPGSALSDSLKEQWANDKSLVYPKATDKLYEKGYSAYKSDNRVEAAAYFEEALLYGGSGKTMGNIHYYMGEIEELNGNKEKALQHYKVVMNEYKGTTAEKKAAARIKKIDSEE